MFTASPMCGSPGSPTGPEPDLTWENERNVALSKVFLRRRFKFIEVRQVRVKSCCVL